ncbi:MAG: MFS transporter [Flaviflexus sp.]|nr:MFS transporter [Flaviflexus sp.]
MSKKPDRLRVAAWVSWDWASAAFNAVVTTFVFSVYITKEELFGESANTSLGWVMAVAGIVVALIAPALGQATDRSGKRRKLITVTTMTVIVATGCLAFVKPEHGYLWLGLALLAIGNIAFEIGSVVYNAMVSDVSTPATVGRISGIGWGAGYIGGIILMLILFLGFIGPEVGWFGVTTENGMNVRVAMIGCAIWTFIFSLPLMLTAKDLAPRNTHHLGIKDAYRELARSLARLWRVDRPLLWFLISSAIYRDGLAGVFSFGGVLAGRAFGFSDELVIVFGLLANLVAGIATISFGYLDDRLGARPVILFCLVSMVSLGLIVFFFAHVGPIIFWVFGLALCVFVGPVQSASRTYLARIIPPGEEGEIFGLYATTGRAVSFLAPFMYSTAITIGATQLDIPKSEAAHFGILGIALVLGLGLVTFLLVRRPEEAAEQVTQLKDEGLA